MTSWTDVWWDLRPVADTEDYRHEMRKISNPLHLRKTLQAGSIFTQMPITAVLCNTGCQIQIQARPSARNSVIKETFVCGLRFFVDSGK